MKFYPKRGCRPDLGRGMIQGDPMEDLVRNALSRAAVDFVDERHPDAQRLDFFLTEHEVHIEVKRLHSPRIAEQMSRVPNVIAAQGEVAVRYLAELIKKAGHYDLAKQEGKL